MKRRLDFWARVWCKSIDKAWTTLHKINYCERPCPRQCWMSMDEMRPAIATMYNVILVVLDQIQINFDIFAIICSRRRY